jgi:hypothetical protein
MWVAAAKTQVARPPLVAYALVQPPGKASALATAAPDLITMNCPSPARKRAAAPLTTVSYMEVARPPLPDALAAQASVDYVDAEVDAALHWLPALPR